LVSRFYFRGDEAAGFGGFFPAFPFFEKLCADFSGEFRGVDFIAYDRASEIGIFRKRLPGIVSRTVQVGHERAYDEEVLDFLRPHFAQSRARNGPVVHDAATPRGLGLFLFSSTHPVPIRQVSFCQSGVLDLSSIP
jgi:hypothetical protein